MQSGAPEETEITTLVRNADENPTSGPEQELKGEDPPPPTKKESKGKSEQQAMQNKSGIEKSEASRAQYQPAVDTPKTPSRSCIPSAFRHATKTDMFLLFCGAVASAGAGALMPVLFLIMGSLIEEMSTTLDTDYYVHVMAWLGLAAFFAGWIATSCFEIVADKQIIAFKEHYFSSVIRQEMAWYDQTDVGSLASRLEADCASIRNSIGLKLAMVIQNFVVAVAGIVIGFTKSWELTLVSASLLPLLGGFAILVGWAIRKQELESIDSYAKAGSVSEEAFMSMRTVVSLGIEKLMITKYRENLKESEQAALNASRWVVVGIVGLILSVFCMCSLGLWYGGKLVADSTEEASIGLTGFKPDDPTTWPKPKFSGATAITVFFVILTGAFSISNIIPNITAFLKANSAAMDLEKVIGRVSPIDPLAKGGRTDVRMDEDIEFSNVAFSYPSRPEKPIFMNLNLHIPAGKSVALVGGSGCGKSTILQLLQRVYECDKGSITIGGMPIRDINISTLRGNMGVVSQEPRLFSTTVRKNIELGTHKETTMEEVIEAAKQANAHQFITLFPNEYETDCGAYGGQLSGGQKQRIAIARALIRKPSILIFDEATSALDTQSEKVVQEALDSLVGTSKATRLIVAHRLSTIQNADVIIVLEPSDTHGATVVQQGTHHELMKQTDGLYYHLVSSQIVPETKDDDDDEADESAEQHEDGQPDDAVPLKQDTRRSTLPIVSAFPSKTITIKTRSANFRTYKLILKHWFVACATLIAAVIGGVLFPVFGYSFASFLTTYFSPYPQTIRDGVEKWALILAGIGLAQAITDGVTTYGIDFCGYKVATVLRDMAFTQTVHQNIAFFDKPENNAGKLCSILSADVLNVKTGCTGNVVTLFQVGSALLAGIIIALCVEWRLALVVLAFGILLIPANMIGGKANSPTGQGANTGENEGPAMIMNQATTGIRVVSAFGLENVFIKFYTDSVRSQIPTKVKGGLAVGFAYGFSQGVHYFVNCLSLWYGSKLVVDEGISSDSIMRTIFALTMALSSVGKTVLYSTDGAKAAQSGKRVYSLIDRPSEIDIRDGGGKVLQHETFKAKVEFDRINFTYPNRPDNRVYRNVSFTINPGEAVALVGASGCGKSTIVQLLERFYDLKSSRGVPIEAEDTRKISRTESASKQKIGEGRILLDDDDLRDLNTVSVRLQEGLVSQEPILFDMTIEENIAISKPGATMTEVQEAAKLANAAGFISTFANGFKTNVGRGGTQLSGGQKQRIAIARALIRKPRVLILDEATSALDAESEKIVQQTIDELLAAEKRSTVIIAHRLSTVRNADKIVVLTNEDRRGSRVAEVGTHDELMQKKGGLYRTLVKLAAIHTE